jgi:hypothetical protein
LLIFSSFLLVACRGIQVIGNSGSSRLAAGTALAMLNRFGAAKVTCQVVTVSGEYVTIFHIYASSMHNLRTCHAGTFSSSRRPDFLQSCAYQIKVFALAALESKLYLKICHIFFARIIQSNQRFVLLSDNLKC